MENNVREYLNQDIFKTIFNSLNIGIHIVDHKGVTIFYNKVCEEIEGLSEKWIIGKNMKKLVTQGVYSESIAIEVIERGKEISKIQRVNNKYIHSTGVPIYKDGKLIMVVANIVDITKIEELKLKYNEIKDMNIRIQNELSMLNELETKRNSIIYRSKKMQKIVELALRVSKVDSTVLIEGESGVGKGVLSKHIHNNSSRRNKPFVKVDCSSLSENLIESELFGYEAGSFTGANREGKSGLLQMADGGTLFLDEIGELPLKFQVKLLGVIQDKVFQKVGGNEDIRIDTRIIAATNRDLQSMVEMGTFRKDLYYRLKVVKIKIPPLRERREDIVLLINYFLNKHNKNYNYNKTISSSVMKMLINYKWPGNIRELENEVERLVVISETDIIKKGDVLEGDISKRKTLELDEEKTFKENVYEYERILLKEYMDESKDIHQLSRKTKLEKSTLRKKAKRLGIDIKFKKEK